MVKDTSYTEKTKKRMSALNMIERNNRHNDRHNSSRHTGLLSSN